MLLKWKNNYMFRHVTIVRLDPLVLREKNAFCNALLIYNDWGGGRDLVLQSVGVFFGVCWVCRMLVGPLAWRLQALLCGRCSWAGPRVFGVHWDLWGFRSGSVDVLDVVFCSVVYTARVKKMHCWFTTGSEMLLLDEFPEPIAPTIGDLKLASQQLQLTILKRQPINTKVIGVCFNNFEGYLDELILKFKKVGVNQ
jgi:hypothetical protein